MLKEIVLSFSDIRRQLVRLGFCGDKGIITIKFDCAKFFENKETKTARLLLIKPDGTNTAIPLTVEGNMAVLPVGEDVTDIAGCGTYQLKLSDGTNMIHSPKGRYYVGEAINDPTPPAPTGLAGRTFRFNDEIIMEFDEDYEYYNIMSPVDKEDPYAGLNPLFIMTAYGERFKFISITIDKANNKIIFADEDYYAADAYDVARGGWLHEDYKTIKFIADPDSFPTYGGSNYFMSLEETLAWLAENATEISE